MKKLFAVLLSLMLLLPALAVGESGSTVDFGDFTLTVQPGDYLEQDVKADGNVMFTLLPDYDENNSFHPNVNCTWTAEALSSMDDAQAQEFAQSVLTNTAAALEDMGVVVTDPMVLSAAYDADSFSYTLIQSMAVDYAPAGVDLQMELVQMQMYFCPGTFDGTYIFTFTASGIDKLLVLMNYLDAINFK